MEIGNKTNKDLEGKVELAINKWDKMMYYSILSGLVGGMMIHVYSSLINDYGSLSNAYHAFIEQINRIPSGVWGGW